MLVKLGKYRVDHFFSSCRLFYLLNSLLSCVFHIKLPASPKSTELLSSSVVKFLLGSGASEFML